MDVIAPVQNEFLINHNIPKGSMSLIDENRALDLHKYLSKAAKPQEIAGGSAANTIVGAAGLGLRTAYIGKVADDALGRRFANGLKRANVDYNTEPLRGGGATARCLIAVTPDGERSMNTFLGASVQFGPEDINGSQIESASIIYLEGYLFDSDPAKAAFLKAAQYARNANRLVALTLSDLFCVDRHRDDFKTLITTHVDIVFANEAELLSLFETDDFNLAVSSMRKICQVACITRSEEGSVVIDGDQLDIIPAYKVSSVMDTTGAGDQYASGVLAGRVLGMNWPDAAYLGSLCAAEVISYYGARPERRIHDMILEKRSNESIVR